MERQQGREHKKFGVAENVAVEGAIRESHGRNVELRSFAHALEQVEQVRMECGLQFGVALHDNIGLPDAVPGARVFGVNGVVPALPRGSRNGRGPDGVVRSGEGGNHSDILRKSVGTVRDGVERQLDRDRVAVVHVMHLQLIETGRPGKGRRFANHGRSAVGA